MGEIKVTELDLTTLEYVHKILMRDWRIYSDQREDAVTDIGYRRADAKIHAVCKLEAEIMSLIWLVGDAQQEAQNGTLLPKNPLPDLHKVPGN